MVFTKGLLGLGIGAASLAVLAGSVALTGCRASRRTQETPAPQPATAEEKATQDDLEGLRGKIGQLESELAAAKAEPGAPPAAEPQPPQPTDEERGREALASAEQDSDVQHQLAQKYYETAQSFFAQWLYPQARENCDKCLSLYPEHAGAQELRARIGLALGERPSEIKTYKEEQERALGVRIEQTQMEIKNLLARARENFGAGKYKEAIADLEAIDEKLRWKPYDIGLNAERDEAHDLLAQAKELREQQAIEFDRLQRDAAEKVARTEEEGRQREVRDKIKAMFREGIAAMERKDYVKCESLCDEILTRDPGFSPARELKLDSVRLRNLRYNKSFVMDKVEAWKRTLEDMNEANIPYNESEPYLYPPKWRWDQIKERKATGTFTENVADDAELAGIKSKLDTLKIDLDFTDANLFDIIEFIREFARINIEIHPDVKKEGIADKKITFQMKELVLRSVLKLLLRQYGLDYTFEDKVLVITRPELAEGKPVLEVHDVRDLLQTIRDFPGPEIQLVAGSESAAGATFGSEPTERPAITSEQLQNLIRENIASATWEERRDEVSLAMTGNGQLLVIHTPKVQQEIRDFLKSLRSFTGAMVSIESRFIAVSDDFVQDLGVEFKGENDAGAVFTAAGADNTTGSGLAGVSAHETSNEVYDLRFRSSYSVAAAAGVGPVGTTKKLGTTLSNVGGPHGGLALTYAVLNNPNIETVLQAVEKSQRATQLRAPRVTAFNTQRSHILVQRQETYVKDYDVEIATNAIAYDPVIGVLQTGLVFDVRPIISNDRKYITLELRPAIAVRENLVNFTIALINQVRVEIQLPTVQLQRAQTTIRLPDKGTALIAGLKNVLERDIARETPLLARIPILNFLFSRKTKAEEKGNLIILITAEIIDAAEREKAQR
ncbi:MAG: hypothetical protein HZA54_20210 [Planctomycetes bacterium]|nr:hypothetical protein [Planctomycetota bacterium]